MRLDAVSRGLLIAATLWVALAAPAGGFAQTLFYSEIERDGRIYVFADGRSCDLFQKGGEMGKSITRPGYGPNGETVLFDSEDAISLYNFKHGLPGESFPKPEEKPKSPYPSGKVNGLVFGDYYWFSDHHDPQLDGQQGFWLRRAYLGYDHAFSDALSARLRLEMNSNGQLEGGDLVPYVKDAYVTWKYHHGHQARLGIQPSLTFDSEEGFWGLRHIEKTPADLYRIDSSRDLGLAFSGPIGESALRYAVQLGNDTGNGSETDQYKIVRLQGLFEGKSGLLLEGNFNYGQRPGGQDRTTAKGLAGFRSEAFRAAAEYVWQERKSGNGRRREHEDRDLVWLRGLGFQAEEGERLRPRRRREGQAGQHGSGAAGRRWHRLPGPERRLSVPDLPPRARVVPALLGSHQPERRVGGLRRPGDRQGRRAAGHLLLDVVRAL